MIDIFIITSGLLVLIFGALMFFFPELSKKPSKLLDRLAFVLDEILNPFRFLVGLFLLAVGGWMLYLVVQFPEYYLLHLLWVVLMFMGIVYMFFPHWLLKVKKSAERTVFLTDKFVWASCKSAGLVFIATGIYILYRFFTLPK